MKREAGFYWVKIAGEWEVAWCKADGWSIFGDPRNKDDLYFDEINEQRIDRIAYTLGIKRFDKDGKEIK